MCKPPGNRFAALAEAESEEEEVSQPALAVRDISKAEAEHLLAELLNGWVHSCPVEAGSTRQAACAELEARLAWLPLQLTVHTGAAWQAAVESELEVCAAALSAIRMCAPRRA